MEYAYHSVVAPRRRYQHEAGALQKEIDRSLISGKHGEVFLPGRLDALFTQAGQAVQGCWVAVPFALTGGLGVNQTYLMPGEYEFEVAVRCENGKGSKSKFKLVSPANWDELHVHQL